MQHTKYFLLICFFSCFLGEVWGQVMFDRDLESTFIFCDTSDYLMVVEIDDTPADYTFTWQESTDGGSTFDTLLSEAGATSYLLADLSVSSNSYKYRVIVSETSAPSNNNTSTELTITHFNDANFVDVAIQNTPLAFCQGGDLELSALAINQNSGSPFTPNGRMVWYSGMSINSLAIVDTQFYTFSTGSVTPPNIDIPNFPDGNLVAAQFYRSDTQCLSRIDSARATENSVPTADPEGPYGPYCANAGAINLNGVIPSGGSISWIGQGVGGSGSSYTFNPSGLSGTITLSFIATTSGCSDTAMVDIMVTATPNQPSVSNASFCENDGLITLDNSYSWTVNGSNSTTFDPAGNLGTNNLVATVTVSGCSNSRAITYTVKPNPDAPNVTSPVSCSNSQQVALTVSGGIDGHTIGYFSNASDTTNIANFDEEDMYDNNGESMFPYTPGNPTIYFQAAFDGCTSNIVPHTIIQADAPAQPVITGDSVICQGLGTTLVASDTSMNPIYTWLNTNTSDIVSTTGTFAPTLFDTDSSYSVTVFNPASGCTSDPSPVTIMVNDTPTAVIDLPSIGYACDEDSFVVSSANSTNGSGSMLVATWDLGDGTMPFDESLGETSIVYSESGSFPIELVVTDENGCVSSAFEEALVRSLPIRIPLDEASRSLCVNADPIDLDTLFTDSSYTYVWDGDCVTPADGIFDPRCESANITTAVPKDVSVVITDDFGCSDEFDYVFSVVPRPIADFTIDNTCLMSEFSPVDMSMNSPDQWEWFIDGDLDTTILSANANPTFQFNSNGDVGSHVIQLVVNSDGCVDDTTKTIQVYALPEANFPSLADACPGEELRFTSTSNASSGGSLSFFWDLGDNSTSTEEVFDHPYTTEFSDMEISVSLKVGEEVESGLICYDMRVKSFDILAQPTASFLIEDTICNSNQNTIVNLSEEDGGNGIDFVSWDPGDNSGIVVFVDNGNTLLDTAFHTYVASTGENSFTSTLTVTGSNGCSDVSTETAVINLDGPSIADAPLLIGTDLLVSRDDSPNINHEWRITCDKGETSDLAPGVNNEQFYCIKDTTCEYFVITTNGTDCATSSKLASHTGREGLPLSNFFTRGMKLYPSPNQGNFSLEFLHEATGSAQLLISDMTGKQVYAEQFEKTSSLYTHKVNASGLAEGIYIAKVRMADGVWFSRKMMVR